MGGCLPALISKIPYKPSSIYVGSDDFNQPSSSTFEAC